MKNFDPSKKYYFIIKSTNKHIGETFINLKVKKGVSKDNFYLIGYGTKEYVTSNDDNSEDLNVIYIKTFYKDSYDIIKYYFESKENTPFFTIKVYIYKNIDYLSFETDDDSEDSNPFILPVFIIFSIAVLLFCASVYKR